MELTPLDLQNQPVLAAIGDGSALSVGELAEATGRDPSNLRKSLKALAEADRVAEQLNGSGTGRWTLTRQGVRVLAALARAANDAPVAAAEPAGFVTLEHRQIDPDPDQPRKHFDEEELAELAGSIVLDNLLENLVVRPNPASTTGDGLPRFILIAGERRWRAIRLAQEDGRLPFDWPIPCNVRDVDAATVKRLALIENLQRKDLKPLEEARAIDGYIALTGEGTGEIARQLNRTQRFVQRRLQLLKLPADKMKALEAGKLTLEEAWRWLDNRPVAPTLTARQWLIALEILDLAVTAPIEGAKPAPTANVEVGPEAEEDEDRKACAAWPTYLVHGPYEIRVDPGHRRTGRHYVNLSSYGGLDKLKLKYGDAIIEDRDLRARTVAGLRSELGLDFPLAEGPSIPWLKGPFTVSKAVLDEIEAEIAETKRREDAYRAEQVAEARRQGEALAKVTALREQAGASPSVDQADLTAAATACGWALPVTVNGEGAIVDAKGLEIVRTGYHHGGVPAAILAKNTLLAVALNAAAGLATPEAEPVPAENAPISRMAFVDLIVGCLEEDAEDLPDDAEDLPDDAEARTREATARAERGLDAFLASEGIDYGHPEYDWEEDGAMSLAEGIRVDGLGQDAPADPDQVDVEDAIAEIGATAAAALQRLATGQATPIAGPDAGDDKEVQP